MPCSSFPKNVCQIFFKFLIFLVATVTFVEFLLYVIYIFPSISKIGFENYELMIIICFQILGGIYIVSSLILYIGCYFESRLFIYYFITLQVIEIVFLTYLFIYSLVGQPSLICNLFSKIASEFVEKCSESPGILTLMLSTLIIFKTLHLVLLIAFDYRIQLKVMTKKAREAYSNNILEQRIESS